jgi:hypothetical protein
VRIPRLTIAAITLLVATNCSLSRAQRRAIPIVQPSAVQGFLVADSLSTEDLEDISIIKGNGIGDLMGKRRRRQMMDTLALQQRRWEKMRPAQYRIRVVERSDCIHVDTRKGPARWPRQVVRDTLIVGTEEELRPAEYRNRCLLAWRVEDLFRDLARALADTTEYVHDGVQYDPVYGFPREYWTAAWHWRSWGRWVESFAPAP